MSIESRIYNYILTNILEYFDKTSATSSQNYYFSVEKEDYIIGLKNQLLKNENITVRQVQHDRIKDSYETFIYVKRNIIIALAIEDEISNDFLVTLRNIIGEGNYKEYSLITIFCGELDSLSRGTKSLEAYQMPLNIDVVLDQLQYRIQNSIFSKKDQKILSILLDKSNEDFYEVNQSVFDIEVYLDIIEKGYIDAKDYKEFGLFKYECPNDAKKSIIKKELIDNAEVFSKVMQLHSIGNLNKISQEFTGNVAQELKGSEWYDIPYARVKQSLENAKEKSRIEYLSSSGDGLKSQTEENVIYIDVPDYASGAGLRTRNIIIFNENLSDRHTVVLPFSKHTRSEGLISKECNAKISGKSIVVNVNEVFSESPHYVEYKHERKRFLFKILVLPLGLNYFGDLELSNFSIISNNNKDESINFEYITNKSDLIIGYNESPVIPLDYDFQELVMKKDKRYRINLDSEYVENSFNIKYDDQLMSFNIKIIIEERDKKISVSPEDILSLKLQNKISFNICADNNIKLGLTNYKLTNDILIEMIEVEKEVIKERAFQIEFIEGKYEFCRDFDVPKEIEESYIRLLNKIAEKGGTLFLLYWDEEILEHINNYINEFFNYLDIVDVHQGEYQYLNMLKLGMYIKEDEIFLTSFNISCLLYYYELHRKYSGCKFPRRFNDLLNGNNQLPFIYDKKNSNTIDFFVREENHKYYGWTVYKRNELNYSKETRYIRKIVTEKLIQYTKHFDYLFNSKITPKISVNVVKVNDINSLILGVMDYIKIQMSKDFRLEYPIVELYLDLTSKTHENILDILNNTNDIRILTEELGYELKIKEIDEQDVFHELILHIKSYYVENIDEYPTSHLTFIELADSPSDNGKNIFENNTTFFVDGMVSSTGLTQYNLTTAFSIGFNKEKLKKSLYLQRVEKLNGYVFKLKSSNKELQHSEIVTAVIYESADQYKNVIDKSDWVTIISPTMTPNYYVTNRDDTIVLHHNDRYTNTNAYDAITISKNTSKYKNVLRNILYSDRNIYNQEYEANIDEVISTFNAINGEWLLKLINTHENDSKEKMSLITTTKILLKAFNSQDMLWIPISMEEVIRVSGALRISGVDGLFTVSALDLHGSRSDDLMLVGFLKDVDLYKISFIPVEVKVGINNKSTIDKAVEQLENTMLTLEEYIYNDENDNRLQKDILVNFFIQIALINYSKLIDFGVMEDSDLYKDIKNSIECDQYYVGKNNFFGNGIIFSLSSVNA